MDKYGEIIEKMSKFLEEEPSGNFSIISPYLSISSHLTI